MNGFPENIVKIVARWKLALSNSFWSLHEPRRWQMFNKLLKFWQTKKLFFLNSYKQLSKTSYCDIVEWFVLIFVVGKKIPVSFGTHSFVVIAIHHVFISLQRTTCHWKNRNIDFNYLVFFPGRGFDIMFCPKWSNQSSFCDRKSIVA